MESRKLGNGCCRSCSLVGKTEIEHFLVVSSKVNRNKTKPGILRLGGNRAAKKASSRKQNDKVVNQKGERRGPGDSSKWRLPLCCIKFDIILKNSSLASWRSSTTGCSRALHVARQLSDTSFDTRDARLDCCSTLVHPVLLSGKRIKNCNSLSSPLVLSSSSVALLCPPRLFSSL